MASLLKRLSKIDDRTKDAVNGWIRKQRQSLNLCDVPMMLCSICILYYHNDEIFEMIAKSVILSKNKKCITKIKNVCYHSNYGINEISTDSEYEYKWDLKIKEIEISTNVFVGLSSKYDTKQHNFCVTDGVNFIYCSDGDIHHERNHCERDRNIPGWDWNKYGNRFVKNDIVSIILDLKRKQINFLVNGIDQGIAYENVKFPASQKIKLRLSVSMCSSGQSVEIVKFSKQ